MILRVLHFSFSVFSLEQKIQHIRCFDTNFFSDRSNHYILVYIYIYIPRLPNIKREDVRLDPKNCPPKDLSPEQVFAWKTRVYISSCVGGRQEYHIQYFGMIQVEFQHLPCGSSVDLRAFSVLKGPATIGSGVCVFFSSSRSPVR